MMRAAFTFQRQSRKVHRVLLPSLQVDDHNKSSVGTLPVLSSSQVQSMMQATTTRMMSSSSSSPPQKEEKPLMLDLGIPKLIPEWGKMFNSKTLFTDVSAGMTVGCIAIPLSLAIALASGVPAEVGLVTAAVSGIAGGLMGGTTLAVTGPAAAISMLVMGAVAEHGLVALPFITMACGALQLASGVTRLGVVAKLVPVAVIAGFTNGIGALILSGQLPQALGLASPSGLSPVEVLGYVGENLLNVSPAAAALAFGTSAAMFALPKVHPKIPSALLAVGGATLATHGLGLDVALIGAIPGKLEAFQLALPTLPEASSLPSLAATIALIYGMTSVESLLSCAALEKMKKTEYKHSSDQELVGQGLANMGSAMFMGMPVTSVIARSSLNVRLNAATRLPALVQSGFVFSSVVFFSNTIALIPMPALSGVLITAAMGMLKPTEIQHCYAVQKMDAIPFAATVGGMLTVGFAQGVTMGCVSAVALSIYRNKVKAGNPTKLKIAEAPSVFFTPPADVVAIKGAEAAEAAAAAAAPTVPQLYVDQAGQELTINPAKASVWQLTGPVNFISMVSLNGMVKRIQRKLIRGSEQDTVVVDMRNVTAVEFTGIEELVTRLIEVAELHQVQVQLVNCDEVVQTALDLCDPAKRISRYSTLEGAILEGEVV